MATKYWVSTSSTSFSTAGNWSGGSAPANSDVLVFNYLGTANCTTNIASTGLTGLTIIKEKSYLGQIGSISGATWTYLDIDGGTIYYEPTTGMGAPSGSPLCMIANSGSNTLTIVQYDSAATSTTTYYPPFMTKGTNLATVTSGGRIGFACQPGEAASGTFRVTKGNAQVAPYLYFGPGSTLTALTATTGTVFTRSDNTAASVILSGDAVYDFRGTGAHTLLTTNSGTTAYYSGVGTVATLNVAGGTIDRTRDTRAVTFGSTAFNIDDGSTILLNNGVSASTTRSNITFRGSQQNVKITMPAGEKF